MPSKNRRLVLLLALFAVVAWQRSAPAAGKVVDLLEAGADSWQSPDPARWTFAGDGEILGTTPALDGAKTSPEANSFLVSQQTFGGDIIVSIDITFETGRYLGVYVDFAQETQSGIWMATGHPLPEDPEERYLEVEMAYIKTVDESDWTVRTQGELKIETGKLVRLQFIREGDDYSVWNDGRLIITYHKAGGYPPGPLQLRLTNARARIYRLEVQSDGSN